MSQSNTKPIKSFRCANVQAAVWRGEVERNGQTVVRYSVRIQKQYRKEQGDFEDTDYYFGEELCRLALVAQKAYEYIALTESAEETTPV